jgi:hypothetical protein
MEGSTYLIEERSDRKVRGGGGDDFWMARQFGQFHDFLIFYIGGGFRLILQKREKI